MGVENLWLLLEPSGSKITIDSLATRKLAVDASLWLVQFMYVVYASFDILMRIIMRIIIIIIINN